MPGRSNNKLHIADLHSDVFSGSRFACVSKIRGRVDRVQRADPLTPFSRVILSSERTRPRTTLQRCWRARSHQNWNEVREMLGRESIRGEDAKMWAPTFHRV